MNVILCSLVGSRMHGLNTPESDFDYRTIYKMDLKDILDPFKKPSESKTIQDGQDIEEFELRHFLKMLCNGNGTAYEILWSDQAEVSPDFQVFKDNKHWFLNTKGICNAHIGYADSQLENFLEKVEKDPTALDKPNARNRIRKASVAGIRILCQAKQLLLTGDFAPKIADYNKNVADYLLEQKYTPDDQINADFITRNIEIIEGLKFDVRKLHENVPVVLPQYDQIVEALVGIYS